MSHKRLAKLGAIAMLLLAFQVLGSICDTTDDVRAPAAVTLDEEFATIATVQKDFESSDISETNHSAPVGSEWLDKWPKRLRQWFPSYKLGNDDDGVPIYVNLNGHFNFTALLDRGSEEEKAAVDPYFDYMTDGFRADDQVNGGNGVVIIIDWDGFSVRNFNSPAAIHLAIRQVAKIGKLYNALKRAYSINSKSTPIT